MEPSVPPRRQTGIVGTTVAVSLGLVMILGILVIITQNCTCLYQRLERGIGTKRRKKQP